MNKFITSLFSILFFIGSTAVFADNEEGTLKNKIVKIEKGDTLITVLEKSGIGKKEAHKAATSLKKHYDVRSDLKVGQEVRVLIEGNENIVGSSKLQKLTLPKNFESDVSLKTSQTGDYIVEKVKRPLTTFTEKRQVEIKNSLFQDGVNAGIPARILIEMIKQFSYDVDFQRDLHPNDSFEVIFDYTYDKGRHKYYPTQLKYASLKVKNKTFKIFRFKNKNGIVNYYNEKGNNIKKALLKTPVDAVRISSRFGKRKHPILGYTKMHTGVDFAAPTGTPIYAAGDGKVEFVGRKGGYGKYIRIKHNSTYSSAYAHLSRYHKRTKKGSYVKQGQVIGYVGSTGRSTGPHLHYEIIKKGRKVNPLKVTIPKGEKLKGKQLQIFNAQKDNILGLKTKLASHIRVISETKKK